MNLCEVVNFLIVSFNTKLLVTRPRAPVAHQGLMENKPRGSQEGGLAGAARLPLPWARSVWPLNSLSPDAGSHGRTNYALLRIAASLVGLICKRPRTIDGCWVQVPVLLSVLSVSVLREF